MKNSKLNFKILLFFTSFIFAESSVETIPPFTFDQYEIDLGNEIFQTVLSGNLIGDSHLDISVTTKDSSGHISLSIYSFENDSWKNSVESELSNDVLFVDIATIAGRDRLIIYENGRFSYFDPEKMISVNLLSIFFDYKGSSQGRIPWVNMTFDLNNDTFDDFIIPALDGFSVFIQKSDGTFADPVKMGPPEPHLDASALDDTRTYREVGLNPMTIPWYLRRVHFYDHNLDGQKDLVFWNEDHFDVYFQSESGLFDPTAHSFSTDIPFDLDGMYSFIFQFSDYSTFSLLTGLRKKSSHTILEDIKDMNGDRIADLVTHTLSGRSFLKMKSQYRIYFGQSTDDGIQFSKDEGTSIFPSGKGGGAASGGYSSHFFKDFNGDNQKDIFRYDVKMNLGAMFRVFVMKTISMNYEYHQMENNAYSIHSSVKGKWSIKFDWEEGFYPAVKIGDVNGDGRKEVVMTMNPIELHIYAWSPKLNMLSQEPHIISSMVPGSEMHTWLFDINNDQKKDIFMYHPSELGNNRLIVLIAK
ncbi:MAG: hypothetical protein H8E70_09195 [Candidatus Marinimicrobia bacterium]|nr:hypothetical protein [Candidatus Neomarinimicrobiota bacterium]